MRTSRLFVLITVVLMCLLLLSKSVSAQEAANPDSGIAPRDTGHFLMITGVNTASCSNPILNVFRNRPEAVIYTARVFYNGMTVTDQVYNYSSAYGPATFGITYVNARGLAPVNMWPLTPGIPLDIFITVFTEDWQPLYEARAQMASCNSTTLLSSSHGPAFQLMDNHSFELAGVNSAYVLNEAKAAFWKGVNVFNDSRVCSTVRGGSSNYVGDCGILFIADDVVSSFKQTYRGTIGQAGDVAYLLAHAQAFSYLGGGKVVAVLTLTDGTILKLKRTFPAGDYLYGFPYEDFVVLPAPIRSAKVTLKQTVTGGNLAVDAVTLSVFTQSSPAPRALPLP